MARKGTGFTHGACPFSSSLLKIKGLKNGLHGDGGRADTF